MHKRTLICMVYKLAFLIGSPCWARTSDIMINSHALCRIYLVTTKISYVYNQMLEKQFQSKSSIMRTSQKSAQSVIII